MWMTRDELHHIYAQLNYCTLDCKAELCKCFKCEKRIPLTDLFRLAKSHCLLIDAIGTLSSAMEIYRNDEEQQNDH